MTFMDFFSARKCVAALMLFSAVAFFSCRSLPVAGTRESPPEKIMGSGQLSSVRLSSFFMAQNPSANREKVERLSRYYIEEAGDEGVNADIAFAQMCVETGFLRFGGLVTEAMNNFCGLGSIGPGQAGNSFPDERTGVRAHVQHLKGYASAEPLRLELVDTRYRYINPKGKAPTVHGLAGTWASDRQYGEKLSGMLARMYAF